MVLPSSAWAEGGHQLTVTAKPAMAGSFNTNAAELVAGQSIQLVAYANANFTFLRWMDDKGNVVSQEMNLTYVMPAHDVTLTAEYEYNPANPANPARNYWNKELGEVVVDDFTTGSLQNAVKNVIGDSKAADVTMITVAGVMNSNDFGIINTYSACTLLDLSRVAGITAVPSYAFDYTNLESVYLPATIEKIGYRAFYECKQLSSLIAYAMTPPALENQVFSGVPDGLVVYVPAAAIAQYQDAAGWKDFTLLPIQEDIRSISVSLPQGANAADYAQMWLELTNTKSGQRMHYVMTDRQQYTFANIIRNTSWNVALRNERGDIFGQIDNVEVKDEDVTVTFASLSKPQNVSLSVLTPDGKDVTSQVQVTWTDAQGNYMAQGASLSGLPVGYQVNYRMALSQELAMTYDTPSAVEYTLKDGSNALTCQLQAIKKLTLSGKVKDASTGLPLSGAVISASQTFSGKYSKTLNAKTDGNGVFTMEIFNVPTSVAIAATDYVSQTLDYSNNEFSELAEFAVPDVSLKSITGATISVGFTYTTVVGETQNWYSDYQNVSYTLYNSTREKPISQFNVQYPQIVLFEEVEDGDVLRLTATSRTNAFMPVEATAIIAEQRAEATFGIVELGRIQSSFTTTGNASVVGSLYDAAGKLVKTYDYANASLAISDLADGSYTLVTMGSSRLFNTIYDLAQLPQTGLTEGSDYVLNAVEVKSGAISQISIDEVPTLDESKLYYTGDNTSFTVNKPSIVAGNYLTLTGRIDFKPAYATNVSNVQMIVDLPESCEFVENSVMVGNSTSSYTFNGHQITIPMARYTDRVRFCIIPTLGGEYAPSAFAQFDLDGETVTQPIGSVNYSAKDLSISVPSAVAKTTIPISGMAIGQSTVEIYDNDVLIGQTSSLANGTWITTCELNEAYNLSKHSINARIITKYGLELQSETVECQYDINAIQAKSVTMSFYNGWLGRNVEVVFDFENGTSSNSYMFYTATDITFVADLTVNDTTLVHGVTFYVYTDKNDVRKLEGFFDKKQNRWITVSRFQSNNLPVNVALDIDVNKEIIGDRKQIEDNLEILKSNYNGDKLVLAELDSLFEESESEPEPSLYGELLKLLGEETSSAEDILSLLEKLPESNSSEEENSDTSDLDKEREQLLEEATTILSQCGRQQVYEALCINYNIKDLVYPSGSFSGSIIRDDVNSQVEIEKVSNVNEETLIALGYKAIPTTDGSKIYYMFSDAGMSFIDAKTKTKYSQSFESILAARAQGISLQAGVNELPFVNLIVNISGLIGKLGEQSIEAQVELLITIIDAIKDIYTKSRTFFSSQWYTYLSNSQTLIDGWILKNQYLEKRYKEELSQMAVKLRANPHSVALRSEMYLKVFHINELHATAKRLEWLKNTFVKVSNYIHGLFQKVPLTPVGVTKAAKITGKLLGGFGVFVELISLYDDAVSAYRDIKAWSNLLWLISDKLPCPDNPDEALTLYQNISIDALSLSGFYISALKAEWNAIKIDFASLFVESIPEAELVAWFASGLCNVYAEWTKFLAIDGYYVDKQLEYSMAISQLKCNSDEEDSYEDDENRPKPTTSPTKPIHDPSGYVYEGVASNRLQGVMASCYYKETVEDMYGDLHDNVVLWDAEEYAQENPLFTDEYGMYQWDVPKGLWQVKFEKEGYETTYSEWLPVPPPQLDVNIAMKQNRQPEVKAARAYEDAVEVEFDKYMMPELLTAENISVVQNGTAVEGTVELLNEETAYEGSNESFASKVRFNAVQPFTEQEVTLLVNNRVKSYAGIRMQDNYQQTFTIEQEIKQIAADSVVTVGYGNASTLIVSVLPASASKGKVLSVKTSSPMILGVETEQVTIGNDGKAEITVSGELPGTAALTFSVEGTDKTAMTIANVEQIVIKTVATPKASIASGTVVEKGTAIALTCETGGATIYYTTDGTCPCDETGSRKVYDGTPIIINESVTIKAMAVAPDMYESEVAEFSYIVDDVTGINEVTLNNEIQVYPLPVRDILNVTANGKIIKSVTVSAMNGVLVASANKAATKVTLNVSTMPTGIYIISIVTESGSHCRKILKVD